MTKNITVLGSTGSIGVQALEVAENLGLRVVALAANKNIDLVEKQARKFRPRLVSVGSGKLALELERRLSGLGIEVYYGLEGMKAAVSLDEADTVVTSVVGIDGLIPTVEAIRKGKNITLANKETLVAAGCIVMAEAAARNVDIIPIDSEHSAIFQCLAANRKQDVARIILTASGGPFRGKKKSELENVTVDQALKHPNWSMGSKITVDSATLMNKGLEIIEARWLFGFGPDMIHVVIHPQSIIHSMVEFKDGSIMAQLGAPDMRIPIQLALTWPERAGNGFSRLNLLECGPLTFEEPDTEAFPSISLAYEALKAGGTMPAVLNGANEAAVGLFLSEKIGFCDIPRLVEKAMDAHVVNTNPGLDDIIEVDKWARRMVGGSV
ncbi:MAG: 1-deoxy-D-xylulose-5-phosphate reductoisomerase [Bacillota bacterium]